MTSENELKRQAEALRHEVKSVLGDEALTEAQRAEAIDAIQAKSADVAKGIETHKRARGIEAQLGGSDEAPTEHDADMPKMQVRHLGQIRKNLAMQVLKSPGFRNALKGVGSEDSEMRALFNEQFTVEMKDATEAGNVMGDSIAGTTGPAGLGQNPFYAGALGPGIVPTFLPGIVEQRFYPLTIADLIPSFAVSTPTVSYLAESGANRNAGPTPEGGQYPFSSEQFARFYEEVGKISNAAEFTDEGLRDAPQLINFIEGRIIAGIQRQEEVQLLAGAGAGAGGVKGLLARSAGFTVGAGQSVTPATGVAFPAAGTPGAGTASATVATLNYGRATGATPSGSAIGEAVLESMTDIRTIAFCEPNAAIMNPLDFQTVRLSKDSNGQYYGGSFFGADYGYAANGGQTLWGLRLVLTPAMPQGSVLVGCFDSTTIQAARREGIQVQMTNTNADNFVKGRVTIRAEERLGLLTYRPSAFQLIKLGAA